jgi:hypothetical protein
LVVALYFGIQYFDLRGMITIVVIVNVIEKIIVSLILAGKLGIKWADWRLFKNVGKMALASAFTGIITLFAFWQIKEIAFNYGALITQRFFVIPTQNTTDFVSGSLTLGLTFLIFVPIYIFSLHYLNLISKEEKDMVRRVFGKLQSFSGKNKAKIYNSNL